MKFQVPFHTRDAFFRFTEKYDMTLSDMAKAELGGHFKEAVLAWVDAGADPTNGVEQVNLDILHQHKHQHHYMLLSL